MVTCELCNKEFQYPWMLRRHLARKNPCNSTNATEKDSTMNPKDSTMNPKDSIMNPKDSMMNPKDSMTNPSIKKEDSLTCKHCLKVFTTQSNKCKHVRICKFKDDEIWNLEIKCKLPHRIQSNSTKCKYCYCEYSRSNNLTRHLATCAKKQEYKEYLEEKLKHMQPQVVTTINNHTNSHNRITNNNNCTTINVNVLGEESMAHVTLKKIQTILKNIIQNKYPGDNNLYKLSAETVADVHKLIRENEANQNIIIPHERREVALIKRNLQSGFVKDDMNSVLDDGFRNTSKKLCDAMKSIEGPKKTQKIHKCVESFSRKGFRGHPEIPKNSGGYMHRKADVNHAQRRFKLANMYIPTEKCENDSDSESTIDVEV